MWGQRAESPAGTGVELTDGGEWRMACNREPDKSQEPRSAGLEPKGVFAQARGES